jgi:chaperonin GroES
MSELKFRPIRDNIIVKPAKAAQKTNGGLIIPDAAQKKSCEGVVVAVGSGKVLDNGAVVKLEVVKGDVVRYGQYSGTEITINNNKYLMMKEEAVLGIIN